ncbi:MAG: ABC transporter permease [Proteobacteria bacterium]|nr:ABC transporter permease [Pseudomonadota bacterium]MBU4582700.1 ABC transporter permease [Pseudomonadota bacterium]MCG2742167.1 ABC transporter permease [Syntrophaceae bacterium]
MKALNRKLGRDLWRMKGQVFAITLVVVSGVATFIMFISTMDSLSLTRNRFYRDYRFADVFVNLKRAPESLKEKIQNVPGVHLVETRVSAYVKLDIKGFDEPVTARIISIPDDGKPLLNRLYINKGRLADPAKDNEVVINQNFAQAHGFDPGDRFAAIIHGKWKELTITGIALSPEFVLIMRPEAMSPDFKHYGILWMGRKALGKSYEMDGAFNNVVLTLHPEANVSDVLTGIDRIVERYGGYGAYARKDQISHRLLNEEFRQLQTSSTIFPTIFICVAAFLLNVVMSRTINTQREQIAALKAFGYSNLDVGIHYAKLVILIISAGLAGGIAAGVWFGKMLGGIYMEVYRFPQLIYTLHTGVIVAAVLISIASALVGTLHSLWRAAKQPPAEAMRPEPPAKYRITLIEKMGIGRRLTQPSRIIARNVERKPVRTALSIIGIAVACATMISSGFFKDAVAFMVNVQFVRSQKEDMKVAFTDPTSRRALYDLKALPGVRHAETFRTVPARFKFGNRSYKTAINGIEPESRLHLLLDTDLNAISLPPSGIVLNDYLGKFLGVRAGDLLTVEVLEGSKPVRQVPVVALVKLYLGVMGYMDVTALNRLMREGDAISGAYLVTDPLYSGKLYRNFIDMPRVSGTVLRRNEIRNFHDVQAKGMLFFTFIATLMACSISFGVVYNSARIALSERSRELSSLRVLGYTRGEISYILLGELGLITLIAIPLGFLIGYWLCAYIAQALASDLFRVPLVIETKTYALAAAVVLVSASVSGLIVRHKLDHLDLVEVLKTRE